MRELIKGCLPKLIKTLRRKISAKRSRQPSFEDEMKYRPDDIVIVSYPKSGSTWLRFIIANLIAGTSGIQPGKVDFSKVHITVPEISSYALRKGVDYESLPSPRVMRSHALYTPNFPRVVYLMRDGRDALLSYYHHFRKFHDFKGTLTDFIRSDIRGVEWNEHVDSWIFLNQSLSNVFLLRYENLLCNTFNEIQRLLSFISIQFTSEQIQNAVRKSSFADMRKIEETCGLGYVGNGIETLRFVRKGQSGAWRQELTHDETQMVKKMFGDTLIKTGYESSHQW